jgi:acyl-CoA thioester hydrolase
VVKTVMQRSEAGWWCLNRRVLPQHTDHAGVMWHGAYLSWLEEARVEALARAGLHYSDLSARGLELPVVGLRIDYRQALLHGDAVAIHSRVLPREGVKLSWQSRFLRPDGALAAEACVDLVLVDLSGGAARRRLQRRLPQDLEQALTILREGPADTEIQP